MKHYVSGRLVKIECDKCNKTIRPTPDIAHSGWTAAGKQLRPSGPLLDGVKLFWDYCDDHPLIGLP